MQDVKNLVNYLTISLITATSYLIMFFYFFKDRKFIVSAGVLGITIQVSTILFCLINFKKFFNLFHTIFFPMGGSAFKSTSLIIMLFPTHIFFAFATLLCLISLTLFSCLIYFANRL